MDKSTINFKLFEVLNKIQLLQNSTTYLDMNSTELSKEEFINNSLATTQELANIKTILLSITDEL